MSGFTHLLMKSTLYAVAFGFIASACAASQPVKPVATAAAAPALTAEDFSKFRPRYEVPARPAAGTAPAVARPDVLPTHHINDQLHPLLDSIALANRNIRYAQGYRILVYNGNERKQAMDLRKAIINRLPDENEYLTYRQPSFRLKVGDYLSRIDAQNVLNRIHDIAPGAMIVSEQITVNKPQGKDAVSQE